MEEKDQDTTNVTNGQDQQIATADINSINNNSKTKLNGTPKIEIFPSSCVNKEKTVENPLDQPNNVQKDKNQ